MAQPIPKKIQTNNPTFSLQPFNTLLIDGSNLLEICFAAHKKTSSDGKEIGGIVQFLLQVKLLLMEIAKLV